MKCALAPPCDLFSDQNRVLVEIELYRYLTNNLIRATLILQFTLGPNAQYQMGRDRQAARLRMAEEILKAYDSSGYAMSKKLSHHKIAEAQRQYANLYWSGKLVK